MRARISTAALRRIGVLEERRSATRIVGLWPAILGLDEWEALAGPMQEKLCMDTRHDDSVVISLPDPSIVGHRYKPNCTVFGTTIKKL